MFRGCSRTLKTPNSPPLLIITITAVDTPVSAIPINVCLYNFDPNLLNGRNCEFRPYAKRNLLRRS